MTDDFNFNKDKFNFIKNLGLEKSKGGIYDGIYGAGPKKKKPLKVKHKEAVTWMLKAIKLCKMDDELKSILRMRMWGWDPNQFNPMTCRDIAIRIGVRVAVVEDFEREAKEKLKEFLSGKSLSDIIFQFNKNQLGGNVLTDKYGKPLTG